MAEDLNINRQLAKDELYRSLLPQLKALTEGEEDRIANMANVAAVLKEAFQFWWIGFYLVKDGELVLGPFQGPVACTRIGYGKGVCGTAWEKEEVIIVDDVDHFPGHIACSSLSRSEIVVPLLMDGKVSAVLDADSEHVAHFDETDSIYLQQIVQLLK